MISIVASHPVADRIGQVVVTALAIVSSLTADVVLVNFKSSFPAIESHIVALAEFANVNHPLVTKDSAAALVD